MESTITEFFSHYAYSPFLVYGAICIFMLMSAVGMPIPEEVVLISAGLIGYMALNPADFPPPTPDAPRVNVYILAAVAFFAVIGADYLIYFIGKRLGPRLFKMKWFTRLVKDNALEKIRTVTNRHGAWAVFAFRFTPGIRFPGHLMCGAMGITTPKFLAIDVIAAGISVPTQVLLVSFYGEFILQYFKRFKIVVFSVLAAAVIAYILYRFIQKRRTVTPVESK